MMAKHTLLVAACSLAAAAAQAQPVTVTASAPTFGNLYAQQRIDLLPGFEATADGFEAKIKLLESVGGRWSEPQLWTPYKRYENTAPADIPPGFTQNSITGLIGIHTHLTPDGKVLSWEGHNDNGNSGHLAHAYTWNPNPNARNGTQTYPNVYSHYDNLSSNLFCSGHSFLADGRLLVAGGHYSLGEVYSPQIIAATFPQDVLSTRDYGYGYVGLRDLNTFNYRGDVTLNSSGYVWQTSVDNTGTSLPRPTLPPMSYRRWYPTSTTLGDGRAVVVSGQAYVNAAGVPVQGPPEVYDPATNAWQVLGGAARQLPLYPWMFLASDGRVFNAGPNPDAKFLNVSAGIWDATTYNTQLGQNREYGSAVMYAPGKILILGGASWTSVTNTTERIDLNAAGGAPQFQPAAPMTFARTHVNATILADGSVLATGGTKAKTTNDNDAVLHAELWQPDNSNALGGAWTLMSEMSTPRLYHSTAVLLPDATVLTTGGGQGGGFADHPDYEIFTPPYLCQGLARPVISSAPQSAAYGQPLLIRSPQASSILSSGRATLVRLSSVTHAFNMNQRFLELPRRAGPSTSELYLDAPGNPNDCPPGHYMLFLIDGNGTPSLASIVSITAGGGCAHSLSISQSTVSQTSCDKVTRFTVNGGVSVMPYNWTVNGIANGQSTNSFIDVATSTNAPSVQVQVTQSPECGVSAALTSYFPRCDAPPCRNCLPQRAK